MMILSLFTALPLTASAANDDYETLNFISHYYSNVYFYYLPDTDPETGEFFGERYVSEDKDMAWDFSGKHFSVTTTPFDIVSEDGDEHVYGIEYDSSRGWGFNPSLQEYYATIQSLNNETIKKLVVYVDSTNGNTQNKPVVTVNGTDIPYTESESMYSFDNINASEAILSVTPGTSGDNTLMYVPKVDVYFTPAPVSYIDADGNAQNCTDYTLVTDSDIPVNWNGWYVVPEDTTVNISDNDNNFTIDCLSHVHLTLCDGVTLNVTGNKTAIRCDGDDSSLNIYGQSDGTGTLNASVSSSDGSCIFSKSTTINGGIVNITDSNTGFGIPEGGSLTFDGGKVNVTGNQGISAVQANITFNGSAVEISTESWGIYNQNSTVIVNAGSLTVTGKPKALFDSPTTVSPDLTTRAGVDLRGSEITDSYNGQEFVKYSIPAYHNITWRNYDDSLIEITQEIEDELPWHSSPERPEDDDYTYEFAGWEPDVIPVTEDTTYHAVFNATPKYETGYYIIGTMTDWKVNPDYMLTENQGEEIEEYMYSGIELTTDSEFKVVFASPGEEKTWFPDINADNYGQNGEITVNGPYTVYFRPASNGGEDWFCHMIYAVCNIPEESKAVIEAINALPTEISASDRDAIEAARTAYEALTDEQKALIDEETYGKLTAAEEKLNQKLVNESYMENDTTEVLLGSRINVYGAASGGTGEYTYAFYYKKSSGENWIEMAPAFTTDSASCKPPATVSYDVKAVVMDANGNTEEKIFTVKVTGPLVNKSKIVNTEAKIGEKISVVGAASGGAGGYTYAFYYKKSSKTDWYEMAPAYTTKRAAFKPLMTVSYDVKIIVKDADGNTEEVIYTIDVSGTFDITE